MGMFAELDLAVEHPRPSQVVDVMGSPRRLVRRIRSCVFLPYVSILTHREVSLFQVLLFRREVSQRRL